MRKIIGRVTEASAQNVNVTLNFPVIIVKVQGQNRRAEICSLVISVLRYDYIWQSDRSNFGMKFYDF